MLVGSAGADAPGLAGIYAPDFRIGAAVNARTLVSHADLLRRHFNSITAENEMKWALVEPEPGEYRFDAADRMVAFAAQHRMGVRGHTLVWHNQTPEWAFSGTRADVLARMRSHIDAVMGHYRGKIYSWDVVNEAVADGGDGLLRPSRWLAQAGEDFVAEAFRAAHRADPDAQLFYNDYNAVLPAKRERIRRLVETLRSQGVPIHGLGIQGHWRLDAPPASEIQAGLELFAGLGLRLQVTELDVSLYAAGDRSVRLQPEAERLERQAQRYAEIFSILREHCSVLDAVTFWGIADDATWLDNFPVRGRKDWPLLFDVQHRVKPALRRVAELARPG